MMKAPRCRVCGCEMTFYDGQGEVPSMWECAGDELLNVRHEQHYLLHEDAQAQWISLIESTDAKGEYVISQLKATITEMREGVASLQEDIMDKKGKIEELTEKLVLLADTVVLEKGRKKLMVLNQPTPLTDVGILDALTALGYEWLKTWDFDTRQYIGEWVTL